ncbi:protein PIN-LIKES 3-like isoform X2 [Magnolia sinica]|uniref:protein PIN-LIKES 3-like isoform X2 n=1 Tax=Magnolia sinica TaxID=86752 RepID=UPI002658CF5E|nr:protein PIN-LIKES 3-like isoform X2 [Magnolia sinica]
MGLKSLFVASSVPVLEVLIVTAVGSFLAIGRVGLLDQDARNHMNNIVFYVFNPSLVATNLAKTITLKSLVELWFMPVNILLTFIIGSALGWIIIKILKAPSRLNGLILGCCSAGNLGNILIIIIPAICNEEGSPFGDSTVCQKYGLGYASLSMAIGAIFIWTYVYNIVRISSTTSTDEDEVNGYKPIMGSPEEASESLPGGSTGGLTLAGDFSTSEHLEDQRAPSFPRPEEFIEKEKIVGFTIGLITPIRKAFIGDSAPLRAVEDSAVLLANAAIPTVTLILGGNLIKGIQGSGIRITIVIGIIVVRYILLPVLGIGIVKAAIHFGFVGNNPLYQFMLLVQYALPPAMNISTITQLFGAGESECSVIFLWAYILATVALTLWCMFFMWFVG